MASKSFPISAVLMVAHWASWRWSFFRLCSPCFARLPAPMLFLRQLVYMWVSVISASVFTMLFAVSCSKFQRASRISNRPAEGEAFFV